MPYRKITRSNNNRHPAPDQRRHGAIQSVARRPTKTHVHHRRLVDPPVLVQNPLERLDNITCLCTGSRSVIEHLGTDDSGFLGHAVRLPGNAASDVGTMTTGILITDGRGIRHKLRTLEARPSNSTWFPLMPVSITYAVAPSPV